MGLSVGRAAGHTWSFAIAAPDSRLDSKPQGHLEVLIFFPLGWNLGLFLMICLQNHCMCVALLQGSLDRSWVGPSLPLTWLTLVGFMALCHLGPPTCLAPSPTMPMCTKSLSQLTGKLLKVVRCFSKAVPGQPFPEAQLDMSSCCSSKFVGLDRPISHHIAVTYVHSHLSSFVEVRV